MVGLVSLGPPYICFLMFGIRLIRYGIPPKGGTTSALFSRNLGPVVLRSKHHPTVRPRGRPPWRNFGGNSHDRIYQVRNSLSFALLPAPAGIPNALFRTSDGCSRRRNHLAGRHVAVPPRSQEGRPRTAVVCHAASGRDQAARNDRRSQTRPAEPGKALIGRPLSSKRLRRAGLVSARHRNPGRLAGQASGSPSGAGPLGNTRLARRPRDRHAGQPNRSPGA